MKIVITGSRGFIGSSLASYFLEQGHELLLLSRNPLGPHAYYWDPEEGRLDPSLLENSDVVIHLSGENILGRWNQKKKDQIKRSRYLSTEFLCTQLLKLNNPPKIYIGASAVGYYGDRGEEELDESSPPGEGFLAEVCQYWEKIPRQLESKNIRVVLSRFGIVLGHGGALQQIEKAFRTGMGGVLGSGKQWMSWIAIEDVSGALSHLIAHPEITGPVNCVAPEFLTNREFTQKIGQLLHRPTIVSVPKFALSLLFGEGAEMFLASTKVHPKKLIETGYQFRYPQIESALRKHLQPH